MDLNLPLGDPSLSRSRARLAARVARLAAWAVLNPALVFAELLADLLAPLLLLAGASWWALLHVLRSVRLDGVPQAKEVLDLVVAQLPRSVMLEGTVLTPLGLLGDGLLLLAVVAVCRTLGGLIGRVLLDG